MYCGKCGTEIQNNVSFCTNCGTKLSSEENAKTKIVQKKKKAVILAIVLIAVIVIVGIIIKSSYSSNQIYDSYEDVLRICCEAVNKKDKRILDDVVYEELSSDWNNENVYNTVDNYYDYQTEWDEYYGELSTDIDSYDHYTSETDLEDLQDYIFSETGKIVSIDEAYELEMDNESCMEICLIKIGGCWYVLYLDL